MKWSVFGQKFIHEMECFWPESDEYKITASYLDQIKFGSSFKAAKYFITAKKLVRTDHQRDIMTFINGVETNHMGQVTLLAQPSLMELLDLDAKPNPDHKKKTRICRHLFKP